MFLCNACHVLQRASIMQTHTLHHCAERARVWRNPLTSVWRDFIYNSWARLLSHMYSFTLAVGQFLGQIHFFWTYKHQSLDSLCWRWTLSLFFYLIIIRLMLTVTPVFVIHSEEGEVWWTPGWVNQHHSWLLRWMDGWMYGCRW